MEVASLNTCVALWSFSRYRATTPAACGAAMDVPLRRRVPPLPPRVDVMDTPGANRSTHAPKLEKPARVSLLDVAPTVMALAARAGEALQASLSSLPRRC